MRDQQRWLGGALGGELPGLRGFRCGTINREQSGVRGAGGLLSNAENTAPSYQATWSRVLLGQVRKLGSLGH